MFRSASCVPSLTLIACLSTAAAASAQNAQQRLVAPEPLTVTTSDGVTLSARYFGVRRRDRETPIVVLLHQHEGSQKDWDVGAKTDGDTPDTTDMPDKPGSLPQELQKRGIAVLTLSLRGHENSTVRPGGKLDPTALRRADFVAMATRDMEAVKHELVRRHNAGDINIERLGIVGAELGASIALLWTRYDWTNALGERKDYDTIDGGKRGRDVKALVLMSPRYNLHGLRITSDELSFVQAQIPARIIYGSEDAAVRRDAERIYKGVFNPRVDGEKDKKATEKDKKAHDSYTYATKFQGTQLLDVDEEVGPGPASKLIVEFLETHLKKRLTGPEIAWKLRRTPFGLQSE